MAERPLPLLAWSVVEGDPGPEHRALFGRKFRRIGSFVKLAQVAAARCLAQRPELDPSRAGLIIGTGLGNTADIVPLAEGVLHPSRPRCSPMSFAGCLGNAASFFVARSTGCVGPNVTLSQEELSFEAALQAATLALRAGDLELALVGGVDVISGSDAEQRRRMNAGDTPGRITQGAAFVLLGRDHDTEAWLEAVQLDSRTLPAVLEGLPARSRVLPGWRLAKDELDHSGGVAPVETRLLPVASGLRLVEALDGAHDAVVHLQRNSAGVIGCIQARRGARAPAG